MRNIDRSRNAGEGRRKRGLRSGCARRGGAVALAAVLAASGAGEIGGKRQWLMDAWAAPEISGQEGAGSGSEEAGDEGQETIAIATAEEFLTFSKNCTLESYSKGKRFVLEDDINLHGEEFRPIPVFAGTFDGQGHSVIGLCVRCAGSNLGLFRYVQQGAAVRNLQVYGTFAPEGSGTNIGGIAGCNRGTIENCTFAGGITAQEALGGIAGYNQESGVISQCQNYGTLTGNLKAGGIAGYNQGRIEECVNRGDVNATGQEVAGDSSSQFSGAGTGLEESVRVERVNDAGGIAGLSLGEIAACSNFGTVGYPHMGYNMGGIAGRQSGLVDQCSNFGTVQGRKDAGGIVGQFEPYVTIDYEEDLVGTLETQVEELSDMGDSLSGIIENAGDTASSNLDRIEAQMEGLRDIGRFYKDVYREGGDGFDRDADRAINEIQNTLDHMNLDMADQATKNHYQAALQKARQMAALREEMEKGYQGDLNNLNPEELAAWLKKRMEQLEQLSKYGEELQAEAAWLAANAPGRAVGSVENLEDDLEELQVETNVFIDITRVNLDKARGDLHSMDEEMTAQVDALSSGVDAFTDGLRDSRNQLRDQKREIEDQIDQIRGAISDGVDRAREDGELFEDVSDLEGEGLGFGMVYACENQGAVSADYQAGGIVGIIGMETSLDPEQDLEADEERTLNVTRSVRAIVMECQNRQRVAVINDYAGGIAGKANLGALIQNQNYGDITAEDGDYAGGITGSSSSVLRRNYSMCTIEGNDYVGGIAGWGKDILDNYSMVSFAGPCGEWMGTVAGDADEEGVIQGNVYVDEGLGALDGATYEGQARGLAYEEFWAMENMPKEFGELSVVFQVEDQVLKTVYCQYGGGVPQEEIPKAPQKDGYYYVWEEKDLSCIKGNQTVHAVYKAWNTTIASSDDKMPVMLAEANFYPGTSLTLKRQERVEESGTSGAWKMADGLEGYQVSGIYGYSIMQPEGVAAPEKITVHVLADGYGKDAVTGVLENGEIRLADCRRDGSYLVFDMDGIGEFVVLEPERKGNLWAAFAGAAGVLAAVWVVLGKGRKKKKGETQDTEKEGEGEEGQKGGKELGEIEE